MYLSPNGFSASGCHYLYWNKYINRTHIDRGVDDRINSLFGSSIGLIFDKFYSERLWRDPNVKQTLIDSVPEIVDSVIVSETTQGSSSWRKPGVILWRTPSNPDAIYLGAEDVCEEVIGCIPKGLQTIKEYRLIGNDAKTELPIDVDIGGHRWGGRPDFVLTGALDGNLHILDGKGTKSPGFLTADQLLWYGVCYREKFKKTPDKLAYLLWREEPPKSMIDIEVSDLILDNFRDTVLLRFETLDTLSRSAPKGSSVDRALKVFQPNPSKENCRFCDYGVEGVCAKGSKIKDSLKKKAESKK